MKRMKMRVLITVGSPRKKGNSAALAQRVAAGVIAAGGECETNYLYDMDIRPCTACDSCREQTDRYCVIEDDMKILYPKVRDADAVVIASPVYWFSVSAATKLFLDRWYAFGGPEGYVLSGKRMALVMSYADTDPFTSGAVNALRMFQDACRFLDTRVVGTLYGRADAAGDIEKNDVLMQEAFMLGKKLVQ
jgi:multimeric flavodoxin WrbA